MSNRLVAIDLAAEFITTAARAIESAHENHGGLTPEGENLTQTARVWGEEWLDGRDRTFQAQIAVVDIASAFANYAIDSFAGQTGSMADAHLIRKSVPPAARNADIAGLFHDTAPAVEDLFKSAYSMHLH